jgi:hypothetical protein
MVKDGTWQGRKPADHDIIDLVVSKSMWYSHHKKLFSKANHYPDMQKWLKQEDGSPSNFGIWGEEKSSYQFKGLTFWLQERENLQEKGKKGKAKENKKGKAKEKQKDDSEEEEKDKKKKKKKKKN